MNRRYRLRKRRDFQRVYRHAKSYSACLMTMLVMKARGKELRVGFSVNKKIGNAVTRNRIKRRLREATRLLIPRLREGNYVVIVARSSCITSEYARIAYEIETLFQKSGLLTELERA